MFLEAVEKLEDKQIALATWLIDTLEEFMLKGQQEPTMEQILAVLAKDLEAVTGILALSIMEGGSNVETERSH